jgi:hypothetical protein
MAGAAIQSIRTAGEAVHTIREVSREVEFDVKATRRNAESAQAGLSQVEIVRMSVSRWRSVKVSSISNIAGAMMMDILNERPSRIARTFPEGHAKISGIEETCKSEQSLPVLLKVGLVPAYDLGTSKFDRGVMTELLGSGSVQNNLKNQTLINLVVVLLVPEKPAGFFPQGRKTTPLI